jgi:hypothetical protein
MRSESSHRLFLCEGCRAQTWICTRCDRGNRYCGEECAGKARRTKLRVAGVLYQASPRGARKNAERQKRLRTRQALQASSVTHQCSAEPTTRAAPTPTSRLPAPHLDPISGLFGCPAPDLSHNCHKKSAARARIPRFRKASNNETLLRSDIHDLRQSARWGAAKTSPAATPLHPSPNRSA